MRLLLDECLPRKLGRLLVGHSVSTVSGLRWAGVENGALLKRAEARFDVFLTGDTNIAYQQNLAGRRIAIILLRAASNTIESLEPLVPATLAAIDNIQPGNYVIVSI
jgi:predicted nuclease of predicted toxin-antitoxin system